MGRMLGYHDSEELDRPELNKCPDCECYFATEECPLCGKICPEEMRAGNRAAVKHKKHKNTSGRVQFIPWYHTWWFILIMWFVMPVAAIVLFVTSPYSKRAKIIGVVALVLYLLGTVFMSLMGNQLLYDFIFGEGELVNHDISQAEYVEKCQDMTVADFYRAGDSTKGDYITMTVVVAERFTDWYTAYDAEPGIYYLCCDESRPDAKILVRACLVEEDLNLMVGDTVTVFGESGGQVTVAKDGASADLTYPCLYMAYVELAGD